MKTIIDRLLARCLGPLSLCVWLSLVLAGCGGGGGGGDSSSDSVTLPATLALNLEPRSVKTFRFSWANVGGVTEYRLYERFPGVTPYTQIASIPAGLTSYDHLVFLPRHIDAEYILEACDLGGAAVTVCVDSAPKFVSGTLAEAVGYVKASNTGANDQFGYSVALSDDGNTLAVGAMLEDGAGDATSNSGAVYVFTRSGGSWSQQDYLQASNAGANDQFGISVALSDDGNTLAVGAYLEDDNAADSGAVYVFTRSAGTWSEQDHIKASNPGVEDWFGISVALAGDGNTLAVGAYLEDSNATGINQGQGNDLAENSGAVYVFTRTGVSWSQQAYLKASNTGAHDQFGYAVALAGDGATLAVGARWQDDSATNSGAVYVFTYDGTDWSQQDILKASLPGLNDEFGASVALADDGNTLAAGAYLEDDTDTDSGAVYVFTRTGVSWSQQDTLKAAYPGAGDWFGISVALAGDGNTLAAGAMLEDSAATGINGNQQDNLATNSGAVYVFTHSAGIWSQQAFVKASNTGAGDEFGLSVALAGDGNTLAVSAVEDSNATGIGGDQTNNSASNSGAVYLY